MSEYDRMKAQKDAIVARDKAKVWNEAIDAAIEAIPWDEDDAFTLDGVSKAISALRKEVQ